MNFLLKCMVILFLNLNIYSFRLSYKQSQYNKCQARLSILTQNLQSTTQDLGGVLKELIVNSENGRSVEPGDILAVEYVAKIAGSNKVFAKGDKEKFVFKDGSMIKGWDIAISSMKIGEKSRFICNSNFAYGSKGIGSIIPSNVDIEIEMKLLAWLGNQLRPESLFQKDLDIDPFISSTPESIQSDYEDMQLKKTDKYEGSIIDIYLRRIRNISFGFGGSGFFVSQSGEKAPWYLNPNLTFPAMVAIVMAAFFTVFTNGAIKEKGAPRLDLEVAQVLQGGDTSCHTIIAQKLIQRNIYNLGDDKFNA